MPNPDDNNSVQVVRLKRHFGSVKAVDGISFSFKQGEVHGFIGPNGAGKTTTMRVIATIDNPDDGDVIINGVSAVDYPDRVRPQVGFMPDYLDSYKDLVVDEYLDFYARAYRLPVARRRKRLADVIEFTGLGELLDRPVDALSKGMKQRLSLARMLVNDPSVLVLDEPAAGLDPRARVELRSLIRILADRGKAVLISSHILTELSEICDSVTIIEQGRVRASGMVSEIQYHLDAGIKVEVKLLDPTDDDRKKLVMALAETAGIRQTQESASGAVFSYEGEASARVQVLAKLIAAGFKITDFHAIKSDLEDAFLALTKGKAT